MWRPGERGAHRMIACFAAPGASAASVPSHAGASGLHGSAISKLSSSASVWKYSFVTGVVPLFVTASASDALSPTTTVPKSSMATAGVNVVEVVCSHTASSSASGASVFASIAWTRQRSMPTLAAVQVRVIDFEDAAGSVNGFAPPTEKSTSGSHAASRTSWRSNPPPLVFCSVALALAVPVVELMIVTGGVATTLPARAPPAASPSITTCTRIARTTAARSRRSSGRTWSPRTSARCRGCRRRSRSARCRGRRRCRSGY